MKNSVLVSVMFDFKGEQFNPSTRINLDDFLLAEHDVEQCYLTLAQEHDIGLHSHELDVMMSARLYYSEPYGIATDFIQDGELLWPELYQAWQQKVVWGDVLNAVKGSLNSEDIDQAQPKIKEALLAAYKAGFEKGKLEKTKGF